MPEAAGRPLQLSLFPDEFELQAAAVAALRALDLPRARALLDRVGRANPRLVNLGVIAAGLDLLERILGVGPAQAGAVAQVFTATGQAWLEGRLARASAEFVDDVVAGWWRRQGNDAAFLDAGMCVHRGPLDLLAGDPRAAHRHLRTSLDGGCGGRADLWGWLGDAAIALGRPAEAQACYMRALLLGAAQVDFLRLRLRALAGLYAELRLRHPESLARELVLTHAWLQRILDIPRENGWVDGQAAQIEARAQTAPGADAAGRARRFAWLLYLDRSAADGDVDVARREEMADLEPELFAAFMAESRRREGPVR